MDANLAGFVALEIPILGPFAWLRRDNRALSGRIAALRDELDELREPAVRLEWLLGAVFMRRDLTPLSDPPASGPRDEPEAA